MARCRPLQGQINACERSQPIIFCAPSGRGNRGWKPICCVASVWSNLRKSEEIDATAVKRRTDAEGIEKQFHGMPGVVGRHYRHMPPRRPHARGPAMMRAVSFSETGLSPVSS
jgi:hypothetical protein